MEKAGQRTAPTPRTKNTPGSPAKPPLYPNTAEVRGCRAVN